MNTEFPFYNFHQHLGLPIFSIGIIGPLYLPIYPSVLLSKLIWGDPFATIDILIIIHLLLGAVGFFFLLSTILNNDQGACIGGFLWSVSSFVIFLSTGWWIVAGIQGYLPWLIFMTIKLIENDSLKNYIILIILRLLLFYIGYIQYFIYVILFEMLSFLLFLMGHRIQNGSIDIIKKVKYYFLSLLFTFFLTLPLLLPMWNHMRSSFIRNQQMNYSDFSSLSFYFFDWIKGLFLPFSYQYYNKIELGMKRVLPYLSHIGYVSLFFITTAVFSLSKKYKWIYRGLITSISVTIATVLLTYSIIFIGKLMPNASTASMTSFIWECWRYLPWVFVINLFLYILFFKKILRSPFSNQYTVTLLTSLILATFTLLWTTGTLNPIVYLIPIFNRFRWPFKLNMFLNLYLIILASCGYVHLFREKNNIFKKLAFPVTFTLLFINFGYLYLVGPPKNFEIFREHIPFTETRQQELNDGRILSYNFEYEDTSLSNCLSFNYATLWKLYHFSGYENPMMLKSNYTYSHQYIIETMQNDFNQESFPIDYFRTWGVKYYVMKKRQTSLIQVLQGNRCTLAFDEDDRLIYYDKEANPLFYWKRNIQEEGIEYQIKTNTIQISIDTDQPDSLIVNFLYHPFFQTHIDGMKAETRHTQYHQISLFIPKGTHDITIRYTDPYFKYGCILTLISTIIFSFIFIFVRIRRGRLAVKGGANPVPSLE